MTSKKMLDLQFELEEAGYTYQEPLTHKGHVSTHKVKSDREYMVKVINKKALFKYRELKMAVNREYRIADTIKKNFECLLWFYDFFYTKSFAIFVYEHCRDGTLENLLDDEELKDKHKKIVIKDIFKALNELRFLGIIHKNLHPS